MERPNDATGTVTVDSVLDAIDARSPMTPEERAKLGKDLAERDPLDFPSLVVFFLGRPADPTTPTLTRELVENSVREGISAVLQASMAG